MGLLNLLFGRRTEKPFRVAVPPRIPGLPFAESEREMYRLRHYAELCRPGFVRYALLHVHEGASDECDAMRGRYWRLDDPAWWAAYPSHNAGCRCMMSAIGEEGLTDYAKAGIRLINMSDRN